MPAENNCVTVLDDAGACEGTGTATPIQLVVVDALGNAVDADEAVSVTGQLDGNLDNQLSGCEAISITGYAATCNLNDDNGDDEISIVIGPLAFTATGLTGTSVSVYLLPASGCGDLDMQVGVAAEAPVAAGDTVTLTIDSTGAFDVVTPGDDLVISAGGLLLSSDGFASATSTLQINNVLDADAEAAGIQVPIQIYGASETPVCITVQDLDKCGAEATTATCIASITAGAATNLAVVDVATGAETESVLDETGSYVGTTPIVIDSYIQTNSQDSSQPPVWTTILDGADSVATCRCGMRSPMWSIATPD